MAYLPPPKTCRYPECKNVLVGSMLFCQELHAAENNHHDNSIPRTLVPALQEAPVIVARPKFLRFAKAQVDAQMVENLTGYPQLPDPYAPNARLPKRFLDRLHELEEEHAQLPVDHPPSIDLEMLRAMKASYEHANKIRAQDTSTLEHRETLNAFCRDTLLVMEEDNKEEEEA